MSKLASGRPKARNRDIAFKRHILNRIAGIQCYAKTIASEGENLIVTLTRGMATNKATYVVFRPNRDGQVDVTFSKGARGKEKLVSHHPCTYFDALAKLLFVEAGIVTGERERGEGAGLYKTTRW